MFWPQTKPTYTLDELLAQREAAARRKANLTEDEREWIDLEPVGREL